MANQQNSYTGSQGTGTNSADFAFTFPSFTTSEVRVEVDNVVKTLTTHYTVENYNTTSGGTVRFTTNNIPTGTTPVRIFRETNVDSAKASFTAGSSLKAGEINDNFKQVLHALQESIGADATNRKIQTFNIEDEAITSAKIKDATIVNADISTTAEIAVSKLGNGSARQLLQTAANGTDVEFTDNVDIPGTLDVTGNVDIDSNLNVDGNLDVDGTTNLDNTNVAGFINIVGTANVDNVFIDGNSVETLSGDLNLDSITGTTNINDNLTVSGTVTLQNATATVNGSQIVSETATQTLTNKTLTTPVINDMSGTAVVTSGTSTSNNKVYSAKRSDELYYRKGTADDIEESGVPWSGNDSTIATTAAIDARIIDLVEEVGGFVPIANETSFPTANPDINNTSNKKGGTIVSVQTASTALPNGSTATLNGTTLTISNGRGTGNAVIITGVTATIPSGYGFLVETTSTDHTYAFHRLVPKATEVTTVAAKSTEIGRLGTADAVADMAILGTADVVSDLNTLGTADVVADMNMLATSDVIADMNMLAVSDVISDMNDLATSGNITAMSTCSTNIASINNASANISSANNFGDQYQVAANNPSTDGGGNALAAGDLYFNTSANELKVYNGSSWQGGVTASGSFAATTGNTFTGDNRYNDNVKALFGTGSDLEIYHSGNNSFISDVGVGDLIFTGTVIRPRTDQFTVTNAAANEVMINGVANNAVSLYYDAVKKFETTSSGAAVTGSLGIGTTSPSATIESEGNVSSTTQFSGFQGLRIQNANGSALGVTADINFVAGTGSNNRGAVIGAEFTSGFGNALYFATNPNSVSSNDTPIERMRIDSSGNVQIANDSGKLQLGASQDLQIYHDSNTSYVSNTTNTGLLIRNLGNGDIKIKPQNSYPVELYYNGAKKFETTSSGIKVIQDVVMDVAGDTAIRWANSGTNKWSIFNNSAGSANNLTVFDNNGNGTAAKFLTNGAVELYHDNNKKFETTSYGAAITSSGSSNGLKVFHSNGNEVAALTHGGSGDEGSLILKDSNATTVVLRGENGTDIDITTGGNFDLEHDSAKLRIGAGNDLQIYHDTSNSQIYNQTGSLIIADGSGTLYLQSDVGVRLTDVNGNENFIVATDNSSVDLYYDGVAKFQTVSSGVKWIGDLNCDDSGVIKIGDSQDLRLYHGTNSYIDNKTGGLYIRNTDAASASEHIYIQPNHNEHGIIVKKDASVDLYYNGYKKFETTNDGIAVGSVTIDSGYNNIKLPDNGALRFGAGEDLRIFHNGSHNYFYTYNGNLEFRNAAGGADERIIKGTPNAEVELYFDASKKFETNAQGCQFRGAGTHWSEGHIYPWANNTYDLGSSSYRWRNLYTNDLNLSNEGSSNDVDGTWGDWTIQEGESNLFLKNNRSGKKYKFNLTEVS